LCSTAPNSASLPISRGRTRCSGGATMRFGFCTVSSSVGAFDLHEVAIAYFALGDKDRGFEWLTRAFDQRAGYVPWAKVNPAFDGERSDPRFKALVARLKLSE